MCKKKSRADIYFKSTMALSNPNVPPLTTEKFINFGIPDFVKDLNIFYGDTTKLIEFPMSILSFEHTEKRGAIPVQISVLE